MMNRQYLTRRSLVLLLSLSLLLLVSCCVSKVAESETTTTSSSTKMSARRATIIPTPNDKSIFIADAEHEKKVRALKHEEEEEKALGSLEVSESSEASSGKHHKEEKEGEEEHEEEEGLDPTTLDTTVAVIIVLLIVLTIIFEIMKEFIVEIASKNLRPIIESLFGEMTVLGFLSIITFLVTKFGYIQTLSAKLFGELEDEALLETFEFVHYMLFFIMIFFVMLVMLLVYDAKKTEELWWQYDRACRNSQYITQAKEIMQRQQLGLPRNVSTYVTDLLLFHSIRNEFVLERTPTEPFEPTLEEHRVSSTDFNFGRYLGICLGHSLAHSVHLSNVTWTFFGCMTILFYVILLLLENNMELFAWTWAAFGWIFLFFGMYFDYHIQQICKSFVAEADNNSTANGVGGAESQPLMSQPMLSTLPAWACVDMNNYMTKSRPWMAKLHAKVPPTPQDTFYWLERKGPRIYSVVFQIKLVFCAAYCSLLLLSFLPFMWDIPENSLVIRGYSFPPSAYFGLYFVVSILPIAIRLSQTGTSAGNMALVSCIGVHRKPQAVAQVIREEKTDRIIRALVLLQKLQQAAESGFTSTPSSSPSASASSSSIEVDPVDVAEVSRTFDAFDESGDGSIATSELQDVMRQLGAPATTDSLQKMIRVLDSNGDGSVSKEEFLNFYTTHILAAEAHEGDHGHGHHEEHKRMKEKAHYMFSLFDKDGNGSITIGEFKHVLDTFHVGFTVDEIGELVNELDEQDNGTLSDEEFMEFLEKHKYIFQKRPLRSLVT